MAQQLGLSHGTVVGMVMGTVTGTVMGWVGHAFSQRFLQGFLVFLNALPEPGSAGRVTSAVPPSNSPQGHPAAGR